MAVPLGGKSSCAQRLEVADLLIPFCDAGSINNKDISGVVRKRIIVSLAYVDVENLHQRIFQLDHIEWGDVKNYLADISHSTAEWMQLIHLLDFVGEPPIRDAVMELIQSTLAGIAASNSKGAAHLNLRPIESLRLAFVRSKITGNITWDLLCKTLLVCNISDIDPTAALASLLSHYGIKGAAELQCQLLGFRQTPSEYVDDFNFILHEDRCKVREHVVMESMRNVMARRKATQRGILSMFAAQKRPSLSLILSSKRLKDNAEHPQDSFRAFCTTARLPANGNRHLHLIAYFLVCMPPDHPDRRAQIARVVGSEHPADFVIVTPDLDALREVTVATRHVGPACDNLRRFREACITGCTLPQNSKGLLWSSVLHLYMASYCRPAIAKDLWAHITATHMSSGTTDASWLHASASPEVQNRVAAFVRQKPMALVTVVNLMMQS